jgi:pimeloyl-ACP methyl ester carboxylesterase
LERDPRETVLKTLFSGSGDVPRRAASSGDTFHRPEAAGAVGMVTRDGGFLARMVKPAVLPPWLSEADVDFYAGEFARSGFRGGLNWYRNIDRNWELLAPFAGAKVMVPALYVAGDRDLVVAFQGMDKAIAAMANCVPQLRGTIMLPGCGHWTQQERAAEVNAAMIDFLRRL